MNTDSSTNGITVNAGQNADGVASKVTSLPGLPPEASVVANDTSLSALNTADPTGNAIFRSYLGQSMANYKADPGTTVVCDPGDAVAQIAATAVSQRHCECAGLSSWVDAQLEFTDANVRSLGTAANPVLLVSPL